MNKEESLEEFIRNLNGNLDKDCEELAQSDFAKAAAQTTPLKSHIRPNVSAPFEDQEVQDMVKAYKDDYVLRLKNGFKALLHGLQKLAQEEELADNS